MKKLLLYLMALAIIDTAQSQSWTINGNGNINPATNFLGTTNNQPLKFRINNQYAGEIDSVSAKTFIGYGAGKSSSGTDNVAFGFKAMNSNTTGFVNTAIGSSALQSNTTAIGNVAVGFRALKSNTTGFANTGLGSYTLEFNTTATYNTAVGYVALNQNSTGAENTATGSEALTSNTTGSFNTANGAYALSANTTGNRNTAMGYLALHYSPTGFENCAYGAWSLYNNTNGISNTATGVRSLYSNTSGNNNTATGIQAMYFNTTGYYNTGTGVNALFSNTSGYFNTAVGYAALIGNITGSYNTAVGKGALSSNSGTSSSYNTAIGYNTLLNTTNSQYNTAIGSAAGDGFNNGSLNVFVGEESDATVAGLSNVVAVGQGTMVSASNIARFGNSGTTSYGGYANWTNISDGRYKKNIKENVPGLEFINKLRPVTYNLDASGLDAFLHKNNKAELNTEAKGVYEKALAEKEKIVNTGFIAQEVETAAKELGFDFSGVDAPKNENDVYGLRYAEFVVPLVKAVQEQQKIINDLQKRIVELEKKQGTSYSSSDNGKDVLNVWPNPSSDNVLVNIVANGKSQATIKIFDSKGSLVKQQQSSILAGNNQLIIDMKGLATGMYHFSAEWNNGQMKRTASVVKQ